MSGEFSDPSVEREAKLANCKQAIHDIVQHGEFMDGSKEQVTDYTLWLEDGLDNLARINVYDSFIESSRSGAPVFGGSIFYTDVNGEARQDWFGFVGYEQEVLASSDNEPRRTATDEDIAMFTALFSFVRSNLGEVSEPAKTWRDDARYLRPHFE